MRIPFHVEPLLHISAHVRPSAATAQCAYVLAVEVRSMISGGVQLGARTPRSNMTDRVIDRERWGTGRANHADFNCWNRMGDVI